VHYTNLRIVFLRLLHSNLIFFFIKHMHYEHDACNFYQLRFWLYVKWELHYRNLSDTSLPLSILTEVNYKVNYECNCIGLDNIANILMLNIIIWLLPKELVSLPQSLTSCYLDRSIVMCLPRCRIFFLVIALVLNADDNREKLVQGVAIRLS